MQEWLQHIQHSCPNSFFLPQFNAADVLGVMGWGRGAPSKCTMDDILESATRRQMEDLALHELSWEDIMAVLVGAEPLVLRMIVDDRAIVADSAAQTKKRRRGDRDRTIYDSTLPILLQPNPFQFRLLALAIRLFRRTLCSCTFVAPTGDGPGRVLPVLVSITWYNPQRRQFHAHMCALSVERAGAAAGSAVTSAANLSTDASSSAISNGNGPDGLVAILYDPIPPGMQAQKAEHARSEIATMLRRVLDQQCGGVQLVLSTALQPQKVDPTKSPLCAPFSLLFLHARALGLSDADYGRLFVELKQREGLGPSYSQTHHSFKSMLCLSNTIRTQLVTPRLAW